MRTIRPDEVYNLGAQSHVRVSFDVPEYTVGHRRPGHAQTSRRDPRSGARVPLLPGVLERDVRQGARRPQNEETPFHPRSPYGVAKVFGYWITRNYREAYGMFASNGILFNHESPRRGETFVTRKITHAVGAIQRGEQDSLASATSTPSATGATRATTSRAMWRMLQADEPDDYVIATGETHSVREFLEAAFGHAGLDWERYVTIDERYFRPSEVDLLLGDYSKAKAEARLGAHGAFRGARADDGRR